MDDGKFTFIVPLAASAENLPAAGNILTLKTSLIFDNHAHKFVIVFHWRVIK
jgi:hypothetical protein